MNIKNHIPQSIKKIYRLGIRLRDNVKKQLLLRKLRGSNVECSICGWHGLHFVDDVWHERTRCPQCDSDTRHRLLLASLTYLPEFSTEALIKGKDIIHFAPEKQFNKKLSSLANKYVTADFYRTGVDLMLDISNMSSVSSGSFDLAIACDVLEHVESDRDALIELHRILRKNGTAILTVPQKDNAETTYEDSSITDPFERERAFGQVDHLRIYGTDFIQRVESAGFKVFIIDENNFDKSIVERFVLKPPKLSRHPLATNYRKVFFCRK